MLPFLPTIVVALMRSVASLLWVSSWVLIGSAESRCSPFRNFSPVKLLCFFYFFCSPSIWIPDWANFKIPQGSGTAFLPLRYSLPHYLTASALVSPADGIQFPFHSQRPRIISLIHLETQWSLPLRMQTLSQSNLLIFRALFLAFHSLTRRLGCCIFVLGKELTWLLGTQWKTLLQNPKIDMISYILLCLYKYCTS